MLITQLSLQQNLTFSCFFFWGLFSTAFHIITYLLNHQSKANFGELFKILYQGTTFYLYYRLRRSTTIQNQALVNFKRAFLRETNNCWKNNYWASLVREAKVVSQSPWLSSDLHPPSVGALLLFRLRSQVWVRVSFNIADYHKQSSCQVCEV